MLVTMTDREPYRLCVIQRVSDWALLQRYAEKMLELSVHQMQRLVRLYRIDDEIRYKTLDGPLSVCGLWPEKAV